MPQRCHGFVLVLEFSGLTVIVTLAEDWRDLLTKGPSRLHNYGNWLNLKDGTSDIDIHTDGLTYFEFWLEIFFYLVLFSLITIRSHTKNQLINLPEKVCVGVGGGGVEGYFSVTHWSKLILWIDLTQMSLSGGVPIGTPPDDFIFKSPID